MHQLICASFLVLFGYELFAADYQSSINLEQEDVIDCETSIGQAVVMPTQNENPKIGVQVALATGGVGTIVAILGGVGTGMTCPQAGAYEAAKLICGFSIAGLSLGSICLIAAIGTTVVVLVRNNSTQLEN